MVSDAGGGLTRRRREICFLSRSFCNLSRNLFHFLLCYNLSLLPPSFHGDSMHLFNNSKGFPAKPFFLIRTVPWLATMVKEDYHMATCSPTVKSEICLSNISRSMESRTLAILVFQWLYRIPSKSILSSPCSSMEWSYVLTPEPVTIQKTDLKSTAMPTGTTKASWISAETLVDLPSKTCTPEMCPSSKISPTSPASRHASPISGSAKAKLGFPLEGLAFKTGPSTSSRPKPIICAPIINETKPRSVKSSLFLLSISNQCLGQCLILKCRRHHLRQNSPSLLLVFNHTLRTLGLASIMAMSVDYRFTLEKRTISEEESIQEASPAEEDWKKTKVDSKKIFAQPHQSARQGADLESIPPDLQTGISRCTTAQKQQPQATHRVIAAPWFLWPIWSSRTSAEDNWNNAQFEIKNATFQQQAVPSNRTRQGTAYADLPPETLICQTEAVWLDQSKNVKLGWVVLNSNQEVKAKICKPVSFVKGPSEAEAMCIYEALLSLQSQQDNKSIIESDAKNVITTTVSRKPPINLTGTIEDILTVAKFCRALSFSFTPRSENLLVDDLAKTAVRPSTTL